MHIPPYYKRKSWQRFFVGMFFGAVISYCIFLFMYATMYERLLEQTLSLQSQVETLEKQNNALLKDKKDLNEQSKESDTVQKIEIYIMNDDELDIGELNKYELEGLVKEEISTIIGQDVDIVSNSDQLLFSAIENKEFTVDDLTYHFTVEKLTINGGIVRLTLKADVEN